MIPKRFDVDVDLLQNHLLNVLLQRFDNSTLPILPLEAQLGYHMIKKVPVVYNGTKFIYLVSEDYVQGLIGGLSWKTDADVVLVSDTEMATIVVGAVFDGVTLLEGYRVLLVGQDNQLENGVWVVGSSLSRSEDMSKSADFNNAVVQVRYGSVGSGAIYRCSTVNPVVDVDDVVFSDFTPSVPDASEVLKGKLRIATLLEVLGGVVHDASVTPLGLKEVLDPIRRQIDAVVPAPPGGLGGKSLNMTLYSAKAAGTGVLHQCTYSTNPEGFVLNFFDGDAGVLEAYIDTVLSGSRVLSTASDVGVYGALEIFTDDDPIPAGQVGHGLYKQLSAKIVGSGLSYAEHTYKMVHSLTGETSVLTFWVDDPTTVTVINDSCIVPGATKWVSGVPSLSAGDTVLVYFLLSGAVGTHYHPTMVVRVSGSQVATVNSDCPYIPAIGEDIDFSDIEMVLQSDKYSENIQITVTGYNSRGIAGTAKVISTSSRIDTVSNEVGRKTAGSGLYPASGYNGVFDSTKSLKTFYTEELQLLNGKYQRAAGNYSGNLPTAGPNYSTGMPTLQAYVLFDTGLDLVSASGFTLTFLQTEGIWSGVETSGIVVQVKVVGSTGWLDANKTFNLLGAPVNDGDACMVYNLSGTTYKRVSFGTVPRTGRLLVRVGLPNGSNKKFSQNIQIVL